MAAQKEKIVYDYDLNLDINDPRRRLVDPTSSDPFENAVSQLKRQFGDIGNWWKDKLGIKKRGGFQR